MQKLESERPIVKALTQSYKKNKVLEMKAMRRWGGKKKILMLKKKPNTYIDLSKTLKPGEIMGGGRSGGRGVPSRKQVGRRFQFDPSSTVTSSSWVRILHRVLNNT
jgi:hypothetical protein